MFLPPCSEESLEQEEKNYAGSDTTTQTNKKRLVSCLFRSDLEITLWEASALEGNRLIAHTHHAIAWPCKAYYAPTMYTRTP